MPIFINTDNTDTDNKIYSGTKAGNAASRVEDKMQSVIEKVIKKTPDFTTNQVKDPKGYTIHLKLATIEVVGRDTKCTVTGAIGRYPKTATLKQGKGEEMVTTGMSGSATASGTGDSAIIDCVEAITEDVMNKRAIPAMRTDMGKRS